ncbi:hypothetical protein DDW10_00585 [Sulfolobales archaeon SCGC AB-777_J03]|nr:hypothetical protein DDW10_00585 [Sulfolobales archaeon SCGC AB-777_J03]
MKRIEGIISAIILIVTLMLTVTTITYLMNLSYEQQQTMETYVNKFISSPKAFQVGPSTIVSKGPREIKLNPAQARISPYSIWSHKCRITPITL